MKRVLLRLLFFLLFGMLCLVYLYYGQTGTWPNWSAQSTLLLVVGLLSVLLGETLYQLNLQISRWLSWKKRWALRYLVGVASSFLLAWLCIALVLYEWSSAESWAQYSSQYQDVGLKLGLILFCYAIIDQSIHFTLFSYHAFAHEQVQRVALENEQMELQFAALKSQISPHYLFNSLNTIASLLHQDPAKGELFIRTLAQTFQYALQSDKHKLVPMQQEIDFAKAYAYLLSVRHGELVQISFDLDDANNTYYLPPFSIQLLLENALKHNALSEEAVLEIRVKQKGQTVQVINNQTFKPESTESFKIGLENIRKRYAYFTERPIIIQNHTDFSVQLPLLTTTQGLSA
ncbi:histidine kinase [Cytophagales bacterium LB-30]|uniref:Histidine kinase n=1 Tax=Shiella aurantiaca TaxID=3058365 RepID=A0ABT8F6D7_9BACT|nr:histidine kinase [Shiella aurantiaca]MDN4166027.1 histidine kinase [Shiella aurantiaca]